jgi:DeoR/GlpR family transcriptional regulator of sugar metabolism
MNVTSCPLPHPLLHGYAQIMGFVAGSCKSPGAILLEVERHERLTALLDALAETGRVDIDAAAERLDVSAATIRRDLDTLDDQGLLVRTRGGAVPTSVAYDLPLRYKSARNTASKLAIAAAAADLVPPGAVVALNGGTTTTEVARALAVRADGSQRLTVVTNAVNVAHELALRPEIKVVVTGGVLRPQSYELVGTLTGGVLDQLTFDLAVLGVGAISVEAGACTAHEGEAAVNHEMAARAREVVVVADGSKLGHHAFARICTIDDVDVLVTDASADPKAVEAIQDAGVRVVVAPAPGG